MPYIHTIPDEEAEGLLRVEYDKAVRRAGKLFGIVTISSLAPAVLRDWIRLYLTLMHGPGALSRAQREIIAVVVSKTNQCFY